MFLILYKNIVRILRPLIKFNLQIRKNNNKEDPERIKERLGHASVERPQGFVVWIHASSIGESISILPLIKKINQEFPKIKILLTTVTLSSTNLITKRLTNKTIHQYCPIDTEDSVKLFLNHWYPNFAIFTESELWPNLISETRKYCKMMLINGRMSSKSYNKWKYFQQLSNYLLNKFDILLAQSAEDLLKFKSLGANHAQNLGNIKFSSSPLPYDPEEMGKIISMIGQRQLWVAASTHKGEESIIAVVHTELKKKFPDLLTIIIPRHTERAEEIIEELSSKNLSIIKKSENQKITSDLDIYLADTTGELGIFYRISDIILIGGSLVNIGGHNPIEAACLNCAIIYGQYMTNFKEICEEFELNEAAIKVSDTYQLIKNLEDLLKDKKKQEQLIKASLSITKDKEKILDNVFKEILPFIKNSN